MRVIDYEEFKAFFKNVWVPILLKLHEPKGDMIVHWARDVIRQLGAMPTHKVKMYIHNKLFV